MSDCKTVTHEGNVYEFGKDYLFSLNELDWTYAKLTDIDGGYEKVFCTQENEWRYIKEIPASENMGTITPAPLKLIDCSAYMFNYQGRQGVGLYEEDDRSFFMVGQSYNLEDCTNIRLLTVEKK